MSKGRYLSTLLTQPKHKSSPFFLRETEKN